MRDRQQIIAVIAAAREASLDGRPEEAIESLEKLITQDGNVAPAWCLLGICEVQRGQLVPAVEAFGRAISLAPSFRGAHVLLASALRDLDRDIEASEAFARAIELEPRASLWVELGKLQCRLGHPEDAEKSFYRALKLDPDDIEALLGIGLVLPLTDLRTLAALEHAVSVAPNSAAAHCDLGSAYSAAGRFDEAEALLNRARALDDSRFWTWLAFGRLFASTDRATQAQLAYKRAVDAAEDSGDRAFALTFLGSLYQRDGQLNTAEAHLREAVDEDPDSAGATLALAKVLAETRPEEAAGLFRRVLSLEATSADRAEAQRLLDK